MEKCIVTKLKGTVSSNGFEKLGQLKITIEASEETIINLQFSSNAEQVVSVNNNAYFTSTGADNLGRSTTALAGMNIRGIKVLAGRTDIYFSKKEAVSGLESSTGQTPIWGNSGSVKIYLDSKDLKYCTGLQSLVFIYSSLVGNFDLQDFKELSLQKVMLIDSTSPVTGDIANILTSRNLQAIHLNNQTEVTGNLSSFNGVTVSSFLDLSGTKISGNIVGLKEVSSPQIFLRDCTEGLIEGNVGDINSNTRFLSFGNSLNTNLYFDNFHTQRTKFLAIEGGFFEWGATAFVIASSLLSIEAGAADYEKKINIKAYGFDYNAPGLSSALSVLRSKGVDVIINGALIN